MSRAQDAGEPADLILHNGRIATLNGQHPMTQAAAVRDGKFVLVGTDRDALALRGDRTQVIDLRSAPWQSGPSWAMVSDGRVGGHARRIPPRTTSRGNAMSHTPRALALACLALTPAQASEPQTPPVRRGYTVPLFDLAGQTQRQIVVDREKGQYRVRLMDKHRGADCAYPGVEVLPDGTFVATTYGHWAEGQKPYIVSVRFTLPELDALAKSLAGRKTAEAPAPEAATVTVADTEQLRRALAEAGPGTTVRIAPGTYRGGVSARGLRGEAGRPIVLTAADPERPPVFEGGDSGLHLSDPAYVELHDLIVAGVRGNGLNIDDGGSYDSPAHHVRLRGLVVRDIGPQGNRDGIKLSGVDDFRVEGCTVERWGSGGSGIDMVGCHRGTITGCTFRHGNSVGDSGVQAKGGSTDILIVRCRFEHAGQRAVNLGGSTGMAYFRPRPLSYEARDITVEDCTFTGSMTPVAFVGVDGAVVRYNTIYRPKRWGLRILQETRQPGFVPSRNGHFTDNLIAFRSDEMAVPINVGDGTAPETFTLARNAWYCLDAPQRSRPKLPIPEADGVYGVDPHFRDAGRGDLGLQPGSPVGRAGARADAVGSGKKTQ